MNTKQTVVTFRSSSFNSQELQKYYINPENYGDDLARWLAEKLEKKDVQIQIQKDKDFPRQEDFGWFFDCDIGVDTFCIIISHHYDNDNFEWVVGIERKCGLVKSLFGGRTKNIKFQVPQAIHDILSSAYIITHIRWYQQKDFEQGHLTAMTSAPCSVCD